MEKRSELLSTEPEVYEVHGVLLLAEPHSEIIRLDISVDESRPVEVLDPVEHLVS